VRQILVRSSGPRLLLAAAFLCAAASGLRAADASAPIEAPDLRLVPADAAGFVTARVATVADKLGLKDGPRSAVLANWDKAFAGVRTAELERFTVIFADGSQEPVSVYRTSKPCNRDAVLKALAPEAKPVERKDWTLHVNAADAAVHFVSDRLFLYGPEKLVMQVMEKHGAGAKTKMAAALRQAADHDFFAWSRATDPETAVGESRSCSPRASISYYRAVPAAKKAAATFKTLALCDHLPAPAGTEAVQVSLDLEDRVVLRVRLDFADEESARHGVKIVRVARDYLRAMALMGAAELAAVDYAQALEGNDDDREQEALAAFAPKVVPVAQALEKALGRAAIEAEGTTVPVTVSVPVKAKTLRTALIAGLTAEAALGDGPSWFPFRAWRTEPAATPCCSSGSCPAPPYIIRTPVVPAGPPAQSTPVPQTDQNLSAPPGTTLIGQGPLTLPAPPGMTVALPPLPPQPVMPIVPPSTWTPGTSPLPQAYYSATPSPAPMSPAAPAMPPVPAPSVASVKLTVANVTKEPALLFTEGDNGKLVFERKVPAGEAVDLTTTTGKRWVAIFTDNPASETYVVSGNSPWLLRPANEETPKTSTNSLGWPSGSR
jgi:hypothetical protein